MTLVEIAKGAVDKAVSLGASQAMATVVSSSGALTRFTLNAIHQNIVQKKYVLNFEVVVDKNKIGSSVVNSLQEKAVSDSVVHHIGDRSICSRGLHAQRTMHLGVKVDRHSLCCLRHFVEHSVMTLKRQQPPDIQFR